jgi:hypothetical protein
MRLLALHRQPWLDHQLYFYVTGPAVSLGAGGVPSAAPQPLSGGNALSVPLAV